MQRRRWRYVVCALIVIIAVCSLIVACDGSYRNNEKLPLKPWQDYILDVSRAIDLQYVGISTSQPIAVDMSVNALDGNADERYECSLMLNIDPNERENQQGSLRIIKKQKEDRKVLLDIYNEGVRLYWCRWDGSKYERTSFDNAPLLYSLQELMGSFGETINYSTMGTLFETFADIFFTDGSVTDSDGSGFVFEFDLKKGLQSQKARELFDELPQVLQKVLFSIADVDSYEEMLDKTPSLRGSVKINLKDKTIDRVYCDNLYYSNAEGSEQTLSMDMPVLKVSNSKLDLASRIPDGSYYNVGRLSDITAYGKVDFVNSQSGKCEMQYDYSFSAKIDMLELLAAQGDINVLEDDNFFHFRMTHKCGADCGEFCKDKYDSAKGAILDVAFSPSDFGTHDIYISLGARALLGTNSLSKLTRLEGLAKQFLPEYVLVVITADSLGRKSSSTESGISAGSDAMGIIEKILMALEYDGASLSFSIDEMIEALGMGGDVEKVMGSIFQNDNYFIDQVNIKQEQFSAHVKKYDVKRSAIHLYGNDVSGTKRYGVINSMVKYIFDTKEIEVDGKQIQVVDIYNDIYKGGVLAGVDTPMCEEEIDSLIGSTINVTAENIYGELSNQSMYIMGHSKIDGTKRGWQEVELYCLPIGHTRIAENYFWRVLREQELSKWLSFTVKTHVYIDVLENVTFAKPQKTDYTQGDRFLSSNRELIDIEATLTYGSGKIKSRSVEASNYGDLFMIDSSGNRYIDSIEDVILNYYLYGYYCGVKVSVTPAGKREIIASVESLELEFSDSIISSKLCVASVRWNFADGTSRNATLPITCLKINGYSIEEKNDYFYYTNLYTSSGIVFLREGEYTLTFEYKGMSVELPLILTPKAQEEDKSEYGIDFTNQPNKNYFVGYDYDFNAEIFNVYHGEFGAQQELSFEIRRGKVNSVGNLTYASIDNWQAYYELVKITLAGQDVVLPYQVELPPTIYNNMQLRAKVAFKQSGYYQVRFTLDGKTCIREIVVLDSEI